MKSKSLIPKAHSSRSFRIFHFIQDLWACYGSSEYCRHFNLSADKQGWELKSHNLDLNHENMFFHHLWKLSYAHQWLNARLRAVSWKKCHDSGRLEFQRLVIFVPVTRVCVWMCLLTFFFLPPCCSGILCGQCGTCIQTCMNSRCAGRRVGWSQGKGRGLDE